MRLFSPAHLTVVKAPTHPWLSIQLSHHCQPLPYFETRTLSITPPKPAASPSPLEGPRMPGPCCTAAQLPPQANFPNSASLPLQAHPYFPSFLPCLACSPQKGPLEASISSYRPIFPHTLSTLLIWLNLNRDFAHMSPLFKFSLTQLHHPVLAVLTVSPSHTTISALTQCFIIHGYHHSTGSDYLSQILVSPESANEGLLLNLSVPQWLPIK